VLFRSNDFTCAYTTGRWLPPGYPELPLGTFLAIRYQGKKIVVKINDRGPFVAGRVFDLSKAAAQTLGYSGVVQVEAEVVTPQ
jgi:rare lipoprotein A